MLHATVTPDIECACLVQEDARPARKADRLTDQPRSTTLPHERQLSAWWREPLPGTGGAVRPLVVGCTVFAACCRGAVEQPFEYAKCLYQVGRGADLRVADMFRGLGMQVGRTTGLLLLMVGLQLVFDHFTPVVSSLCHALGLATGLVVGLLVGRGIARRAAAAAAAG